MSYTELELTPSSVERLETISRHLAFPQHANQRRALSTSETCGIVACVSQNNDDVFKFLLEGLHTLESRGYDSAGIATIDSNKELHVSKFASRGSTSDAIKILSNCHEKHHGHHVGIAHTRWATHGGKTDQNAHPHTDMRNRIALVHNGVIENSLALKKTLQGKGIVFQSETDTEVIAQLIGFHLAEGVQDVLEAINKTQNELEGTWGIAVIDRTQPDKMYAACNGSPILIGIASGKMFIASEAAAFSQHTKEYIALENGEVAVITANSHTLDQSRVELAAEEAVELSPAPFPHWTIKEIMEQPLAISRALNYGGRIADETNAKLGGLDEKKAHWVAVRHLVIAACGTSLFAAEYGCLLMRWLESFDTVQVIDASEVSRDCFPREGAGLLVLSQSGETKDVHRVVVMAQEENIPVFSIVNAVRSLIARTTACGIYLNAGRENAVASTKAFTCQVVCLALVATWFSQNHAVSAAHESKRKSLIDSLQRLPTSCGMCLHKLRDGCREIAQHMLKNDHCFILGRGYAHPIAKEASLKIKEITYCHAEGYASGALKHGPFALIDEGTPIFLIMTEETASHVLTAAHEVKARKAWVVIVTTQNLRSRAMQAADRVIVVPQTGVLSSLVCILPFQLIAYELSVLKGNNPDRPRHLAKTVTVD
eukprot:CAMPEP_0177648100 /NCGR_PEP_ID=MMETSP0447-20121125/10651_1 /TAXON_ID=0 /ORGANISM="Stygamoeba regulata, Strain BSH-02190019" /LENGTH=655 /DNA_ID=CAMNT_0019150725 /DNA_START=68 /DNA_END=2035 /DNA_ORIENTATION=+